MTNLEYLAQTAETVLTVVLVLRLWILRLHVVYRLLSLYLVAELLGSSEWFLQVLLDINGSKVDYRLVWVGQRLIVGILLILTVYALLAAILRELRGILRLSRQVLNRSFFLGAGLGVLTVIWDYRGSRLEGLTTWQDGVLFAGILADRVVTVVILVAILGILCFLLWFPVQVARNLAVFVLGFSVYSIVSSINMLLLSLNVHHASRAISMTQDLLFAACVAFWLFNISPAGELTPAKLNVRRDPMEQKRLIQNLELLNESLLRGSPAN